MFDTAPFDHLDRAELQAALAGCSAEQLAEAGARLRDALAFVEQEEASRSAGCAPLAAAPAVVAAPAAPVAQAPVAHAARAPAQELAPGMVQRVCANPDCRASFQARQADVDRGWAKCCSKSCAALYKIAKGSRSRSGTPEQPRRTRTPYRPETPQAPQAPQAPAPRRDDWRDTSDLF